MVTLICGSRYMKHTVIVLNFCKMAATTSNLVFSLCSQTTTPTPFLAMMATLPESLLTVAAEDLIVFKHVFMFRA